MDEVVLQENRTKKGIAVSVTGIFLNVSLAVAKLIVGIFTKSVSIITDAVNNFSDSASSVITSVSFALSNRKADKEHPYGHGRYEYVTSLIIGISIIFVGLQFVMESVNRIINPEAVSASLFGFIILSVSIAVKLFMYFFYRYNSRKIGSDSLKAAAADSLSDCVITSIVLIGFGAYRFFPDITFSVDGICGTAVALFVIFSGAKVVLETIGKLLGNGGSLDMSEKIYDLICSHPSIAGAHDLRLHDYGPGIRIGSAHAEFDQNLTIVEAHNIIDNLEKRAFSELKVDLVIHVDPIDVSDPVLNRLRIIINKALKTYRNTSAHELLIDTENKSISFDIKLPVRYEEISGRISQQLEEEISKAFPDYSFNIGFDLIN